MAEYVPNFKKHKIDGVALLNLTSDNLQELGIGTLGHRNRLLTEINDLKSKLQGAGQPRAQPVPTIGLVARNIDGVVKIFDQKTGAEVTDIAAHQKERQKSIMIKKKNIDMQESNETSDDVDDNLANAPPPVIRSKPRQVEEDEPPPARPVVRLGAAPSRDNRDAHFNANWYQKNLGKEQITEYIGMEADGTFVVRDSASEPGCFAISYVYRGEVLHKLIEPVGKQYQIRASTEKFDSLTDLISFFAGSGGSDLKCALSYPRDIEEVRAHRARQASTSAAGPTLGVTPDEQRFHREWAEKTRTNRPKWDCLHMNRDDALATLVGRSEGAFVIRPSDKAFAAISLVKRDGSQFHQHIDALPNGLQLKKSTIICKDLHDFVKNYTSASQADLPNPLRV